MFHALPNQCKATGGCGRGPGTSTASAGSRADSTAPSRPTPGRPPNIVNETLEHGTTYVLRNDGRIVLNGILLPAGAPPGAELAPLVDQAIFENGLRPDEVLLAVSWLCDAWVIECDKDFMTATWTSDVAQGLGADNIVEMLAIGGALSLVAQFPGAAGGRIGSGGRTTCRNSFEAGTLVLMADGSHSPIEDISRIHTYHVLAGNIPVLLHNANGCWPSLDALSRTGLRPARGGLTHAGREYQKHMSKGELPVVPGKQLNSAGQDLLDDILTAPGTRSDLISGGNFKGGYYIRPDGIGAAFDSSGTFQYFGRF